MSSDDPFLLLRVNRIISDITARVNTSAVEILEIVTKYEEELRLAKKQIKLLEAVVPKLHNSTTQTLASDSDVKCPELHLAVCEQSVRPEQLLRDGDAFIHGESKPLLSVRSHEYQENERQLLEDVVPKQQDTRQTLTPDVPCSELHLSACEQQILPVQLLRDEEVLQSDTSHVGVCSLTSQQFVALTKILETEEDEGPYSCHDGDEYERPMEAHDVVPEMDLVRVKQEEEPVSDRVGEEACHSTQDATEAASGASQSFKMEKKSLSVRLHRIPCVEVCDGDGVPSSSKKEEPLPPRQHVAMDCESTGDRDGERSSLDTTRRTRRPKQKPTCEKNDLPKHLNIESLYNCQICGKGFLELKTFGHHMNCHRGLRVICPICQLDFAGSSMRHHLLIHTGEKPFSCNVCGKAFSRSDHLKSHKKSHARDNKPAHTCSTCGKQFGLKRVLQIHQKIHKAEESLSVKDKTIHTGERSRPTSRKGFNRRSRNAHKAKWIQPKISQQVLKTEEEDDPYNCHGGDEYERPLEAHDFVPEMDLVQVKQEEEPVSDHVREEACHSTQDATEAASDASQSFKMERKSNSICLQRIPCDGDGRPSGSDQGRKEELLPPRQDVATDREIRGDRGEERSSLDATCRTRGSKRKPACEKTDLQKRLNVDSLYNCLVCGEGFLARKEFRQHMKRHKKVTCPICQLDVLGSSMKRHLLVHTGEKPYSCNVCGKAFARNDHLKIHKRSHATDKKPAHTCSTCGKQFGLKRVLKMHQRIHALSEKDQAIPTGEGSHPTHRSGKSAHKAKRKPKIRSDKFCPICHQYQSNLNRHLLVHSGEKPFGCEFCGRKFNRREHLNKHICA